MTRMVQRNRNRGFAPSVAVSHGRKLQTEFTEDLRNQILCQEPLLPLIA